MLGKFFFDFFEGKEASVDPSFPLPQEPVDCLYGVDLGVGVWKEGHVELLFVDAHAEDSVLGQIDVFVVKHLLIGLFINVHKTVSQGVRQKNPRNCIPYGEMSCFDRIVFDLVVN